MVDARRGSTPLHHRRQGISPQQIPRTCHHGRGTDIIWPAHSPDLNPLDFHFWAAAQNEVYHQKPESIESLIDVVKWFATSYNQETIRRVSENVLKRARLCLRADWGHFQHII